MKTTNLVSVSRLKKALEELPDPVTYPLSQYRISILPEIPTLICQSSIPKKAAFIAYEVILYKYKDEWKIEL